MNTPLSLALLVMLSTIPHSCLPQAFKNETIVYLDDDGHRAEEKTATVLHQIVQVNDTLWEHKFYQKHGRCFSSLCCSDADGNVLNGRFVSYSPLGTADTVGDYVKGKRNGQWRFFAPTGRLLGYQMYQDGSLLWTKDTLQKMQEADSLKGLHQNDNSDVKTKVEIEAAFPGGTAAWLRYMNKNLRYPDDAAKRKVEGQVIVDFVVDTTGHIPETSVWVSRSVEFALDEEATRIILNSRIWVPAIQNGRQVTSYKRQPIIFKLQ
jgi:TonB family protein